MRLDLRPILRTPGASLPFRFELDLSGLDFYGERPFAHPVRVSGTVRNRAGALSLEGTAETTLELSCDRCLKPFARELALPVSTLLAEELEDEGPPCWPRSWRTRRTTRSSCWRTARWTWTRCSPPHWCSPWTPSTFARRSAGGCAPPAAPT